MNFLLTCIIDEAGGVVGATPEGMGHHILLIISLKITLNANINVIVHIITIWTLLYSLRLQGGGAIAP